MEQQNKLDSKSTKGIITGHAALLAANIIWGGMAPVSKDLLNMGQISSWSLSGVRILGGALLFWLLSLILPKAWVSDEKVEKKDFLPLCLASLLVIAANQALVIMGMAYTSPVDATIVCSMTPIFTLILGAVFLHQKICRCFGFHLCRGNQRCHSRYESTVGKCHVPGSSNLWSLLSGVFH